MRISIVVPVYNERESVEPLLAEVLATSVADDIHEVLFVDDGSTDGTTGEIERLCAENDKVRLIVFRRNFGKSSALDAAFRYVTGDVVVTLDGDLQDDPNEIPKMLAKIDEGYDVVSGWKKRRHDPLSKTVPSRLFNWVMRIFSGVSLHDFNCGLKMYRAEVVRELNLYGELHRFIPVLVHNRGFRIAEVEVHHRERAYGRSKFGTGRLMRGFWDFTTVVFLSRYQRHPLHLFGLAGFLMLLAGFVINAYLAYTRLTGQDMEIHKRPLLTLGVLSMILGFQSISLGLISEMIVSARSGRDHYSIRKTVEPRR